MIRLKEGLCTPHVETIVGSDHFQDLIIHQKEVFRPDLSLKSRQGISSPDVVSWISRNFPPARTHRTAVIHEDAAAPWAICRAAAAWP